MLIHNKLKLIDRDPIHYLAQKYQNKINNPLLRLRNNNPFMKPLIILISFNKLIIRTKKRNWIIRRLQDHVYY